MGTRYGLRPANLRYGADDLLGGGGARVAGGSGLMGTLNERLYELRTPITWTPLRRDGLLGTDVYGGIYVIQPTTEPELAPWTVVFVRACGTVVRSAFGRSPKRLARRASRMYGEYLQEKA